MPSSPSLLATVENPPRPSQSSFPADLKLPPCLAEPYYDSHWFIFFGTYLVPDDNVAASASGLGTFFPSSERWRTTPLAADHFPFPSRKGYFWKGGPYAFFL